MTRLLSANFGTMPSCVILFCLFLSSITTQAQQRVTISGYARDSTNGESLPGATIFIKGSDKGVQTNTYGFFSLTLPQGSYTLVCSFLGFREQEHTINLKNDLHLNLRLIPVSIQGKEMVVTDKRKDEQVQSTDMGRIKMSTSEVRKLPALVGEVDVLRALQLMPGVQAAGEGNAGFYVRGGGPDQNLILLDEAPVYNTGHLFGFFSVFNADVISSTTLIKGGMPANYGGRLSSVVEVTMKDGNNQEFQTEGGIGLIASRLSIQGPIKKNKSSFIVSGRRTYLDLLVKPFAGKSSSFNGSGYYFYDLNLKANYTFSDKDRLYLSGYFGQDKFTFRSNTRGFGIQIPWGNTTATLRWNHVFSRRLFANLSLIYNDYKFAFNGRQNTFDIRMSSGIRDYNAKLDLDYYPNPRHHIRVGGNYIYHRFTPSSLTASQKKTILNPENAAVKYAHEAAAYIMDDWEISPSFKINAGLRYSGFLQVGPYTRYRRDAGGKKTDSTVYGSGKSVRAYGGLEPRVSLRYTWNGQHAIKLGVSRTHQFIHLVSNAGTTLPTDLWVPSSLGVKPQIAWQYALGYFRNLQDNTYEASVEVYYKDMKNQIEYRKGYTPSLKDPEEDFVFGKGWAYGAEFLLNKTKGRLTGWIGYTLAWSWRQFPDLNEGRRFPAKYDRRHDLSVVANYALSKRWSLSGAFIFGSGNTTSLPEKFYFIEGNLVQEYGDINGYRMAPYHRLDLSATYSPQPKKPNRRLRSNWVFSIYNVYNHLNPYFLYFDQEGGVLQGSLQIKPKQVSLFPIIPSVTWNFKF